MSSSDLPPSAIPPSATISQPFNPPASTLDAFRAHPWSNSLLSNPDYFPIRTWSRTAKPSGEDAFFANTLGTDSTIPHVLTLRRKDIPSVPKDPPQIRLDAQGRPITPSAPARPPDMISLLMLSNPGISGHPSTAHGGAVATILDEVVSLCVALHVPAYAENEAEARGALYTMQLDVRYKRPVYVPGLAVVKAWCVARDGRKYWMRGQLVQEEEEGEEGKNGRSGAGQLEWVKRKTVRTEALGFWLQTKGKL